MNLLHKLSLFNWLFSSACYLRPQSTNISLVTLFVGSVCNGCAFRYFNFFFHGEKLYVYGFKKKNCFVFFPF